MRVLAIDDSELDIKGIREFCESKEWIFQFNTFKNDFLHDVLVFDADVIILDWYDDVGVGDNEKGNAILNGIWENGYRPTVIFSGHADGISLGEGIKEGAFLKKIIKPNESDVFDYLEKNQRYIEALSEFRKNAGRVLIESLSMVDYIGQINEGEVSKEVLNYLLAKRMVNAFDLESQSIDLPTWGMYVYPPVSKTLMTGDIIRIVEKRADYSKETTADKYFIVISQSCDIAQGKIKEVNCLKCLDMENGILRHISQDIDARIKGDGLDPDRLNEMKTLMKKKRLCEAMSVGFFNKWGVLPSLRGVCPDLSVNLKSSISVKLTDIACKYEDLEEHKYFRVASLDSPFVSQLVWGYMQNACRPGAPNRTVDVWADSIID